MAIEAWYMDESSEDKRLPHHRSPNEPVSLDQLAELGVLYWHLNPRDCENDEELKKIRETRGYSYMVQHSFIHAIAFFFFWSVIITTAI
uniref:Uncharacterized protein MANES_03G173600 n=1 Tax=Rhizophora mucronata TaxID=61149 RepID=A0A2P2IM66_RHIMU